MNHRLSPALFAVAIAVSGCSGASSLSGAPASPGSSASWAGQAKNHLGPGSRRSLSFNVLYTFQNGADGGNPFAGSAVDKAGESLSARPAQAGADTAPRSN